MWSGGGFPVDNFDPDYDPEESERIIQEAGEELMAELKAKGLEPQELDDFS